MTLTQIIHLQRIDVSGQQDGPHSSEGERGL